MYIDVYRCKMYHNIAWKYFQTILESENCIFFRAAAGS